MVLNPQTAVIILINAVFLLCYVDIILIMNYHNDRQTIKMKAIYIKGIKYEKGKRVNKRKAYRCE